MARSLNRVQLIGNLTRDPELRYTPSGTAVCSFSIATNRNWTTDQGEKKEEVEFHRIVAWSKLAELCSQFLTKGRKVYVEGRLVTRSWTGQDGAQKQTTEIVISDMILLDSRRTGTEGSQASEESSFVPSDDETSEGQREEKASAKQSTKAPAKQEKEEKKEVETPSEEIMPDDIPF
jgi:single-strand DNA-binding protein